MQMSSWSGLPIITIIIMYVVGGEGRGGGLFLGELMV